MRRRSNEVSDVADWIRRAAVRQALKNGRNGTEEEIKTLLGFGNVDRYKCGHSRSRSEHQFCHLYVAIVYVH